MPCLNITTNVSQEVVDTSSVLSEATSTISNILGKPRTYVMIVLKGSVPLSFGGTEQPAAFGELTSIGGLNSDINKKLSAAISTILETKLLVPKSRFYLKFSDVKGRSIARPSKPCCFWHDVGFSVWSCAVVKQDITSSPVFYLADKYINLIELPLLGRMPQ